MGRVHYGASCDGYYSNKGQHYYSGSSSGRWLPWNPELKVKVRKIKNPVPMYARNLKYSEIELPSLNRSYGFDLVKSDLVAPNGVGQTADIFFELSKDVKTFNEFSASLKITFAGRNDGFVFVEEDNPDSSFKLPREAPYDGYVNSHVVQLSRTPEKWTEEGSKKDGNIVFRVRSVVKGKKIRAMYGKIPGAIKIMPMKSETGLIYFEYYLNPDYTRNLEFDTQRNLFTDLPEMQQVHAP